jgi:UPF0716 protein FxsA
MRRSAMIALILLVTLVAEVVVFTLAVKVLGVAWTLLLVLATTVAGGWLLRREGIRAWRRFRAAVRQGRPPGGEVTDGLLGLVGALLLVLPGFVTDVVGVLLLTPPTRGYARAGVQRAAERRFSPAAAGDLFGPRRVRVRRGRSRTPAGSPPQPPPAAHPVPPAGAAAAIEGEIVEPRRPVDPPAG